MVYLVSLWLPILLSVAAVFVVSSVLHLLFPHHRADYGRVPAEDAMMDALRGIPAGEYMLPCPPNAAAMRDPAYREKRSRGPVAIVRIASPGGPSFGRSLVLWAVFALVVCIFAAYITGRALPAGASHPQVFRFAGATAFAGYSLALMHDSVWNMRPWKTTLTYMADGLVYAVVTGGVFSALWPR